MSREEKKQEGEKEGVEKEKKQVGLSLSAELNLKDNKTNINTSQQLG